MHDKNKKETGAEMEGREETLIIKHILNFYSIYDDALLLFYIKM